MACSPKAQAGPSGTGIPTQWPDRHIHDNEWWGNSHAAPQPGDPDRFFMFCQPTEMTRSEEDAIVQNWNKAVAQSHEETKGLSHHLRPATPSHEKAEKKIRQLEEMGEEITPEGKELIRDHFRCNYGLLASLTHWAEGEKFIPIEHANELVQMIHRLMLENATQMNVAMERYRTWGDVLESLGMESDEPAGATPESQWKDTSGSKMTDLPQAQVEATTSQSQSEQVEILIQHVRQLQFELGKAKAKWKAEKAARLRNTLGGTICNALRSVASIFTAPRMGRQRAEPADEETGRQDIQSATPPAMEAEATRSRPTTAKPDPKHNEGSDHEVDVTDSKHFGCTMTP